VTPRLYEEVRNGDGPLDPRGMIFDWIYTGTGKRVDGRRREGRKEGS